MKLEITIKYAAVIVLAFSVVQFLLSIWVKSQIENAIEMKYARLLEDYRYTLRAKERAEIVAEYLALYTHESTSYQRLNQLSMELALWLPADLYKRLAKAMQKFSAGDHEGENIITVLMDIRSFLLGDTGGLTDEDIIVHREPTSQ